MRMDRVQRVDTHIGRTSSTYRTLLAAALVLTGTAVVEAQQAFAPEPGGLWPGPMHGKTPKTLRGATVVDPAALASLITREQPLLIDVSNIQVRPRGQSGIWDPIHMSLPGAIWLPGAGTGKDVPGFADAFAARVATATAGNKERPIVAFCHPRQWGSWNAAKRLTLLGYKHVYWFPGGGGGLGANATKEAKEDPQWRAAGFDKSSAGDMPDELSPPQR